MLIDKETKLRVNPFAPYTDAEGTRYSAMPAYLYEEILDPTRGDDKTQYTNEIDEVPYVVITDKSPEQLEQQSPR